MEEIKPEEKKFEIKVDIPEKPKVKLSGWGWVITGIYSLLAAYAAHITVMLTCVSFATLHIMEGLTCLLCTVIMIIPYILFVRGYKKQEQRLYRMGIILEVILVIVGAIYFYFVMWPVIQQSINNQWCGIGEPCMRNE